jgi:hypothetical protein
MLSEPAKVIALSRLLAGGEGIPCHDEKSEKRMEEHGFQPPTPPEKGNAYTHGGTRGNPPVKSPPEPENTHVPRILGRGKSPDTRKSPLEARESLPICCPDAVLENPSQPGSGLFGRMKSIVGKGFSMASETYFGKGNAPKDPDSGLLLKKPPRIPRKNDIGENMHDHGMPSRTFGDLKTQDTLAHGPPGVVAPGEVVEKGGCEPIYDFEFPPLSSHAGFNPPLIGDGYGPPRVHDPYAFQGVDDLTGKIQLIVQPPRDTIVELSCGEGIVGPEGTRLVGKSPPMSNAHGDRHFGQKNTDFGDFHCSTTEFACLLPPLVQESTLVNQFSTDKGDPEPMPLPKRASNFDPRENLTFAANFFPDNRSCTSLTLSEPTPKLGCSTLGKLPETLEKTEGKNSPGSSCPPSTGKTAAW